MAHHNHAQHMQHCIDNCTQCHNICMETVRHCLEMGGDHASAAHITTLLDCAQACATSADFMLRNSEMHGKTCGVCAEACTRCADECERMANGDEQMLKCAEICRQCAETCKSMAA